jgi:hypothetical protein
MSLLKKSPVPLGGYRRHFDMRGDDQQVLPGMFQLFRKQNVRRQREAKASGSCDSKSGGVS